MELTLHHYGSHLLAWCSWMAASIASSGSISHRAELDSMSENHRTVVHRHRKAAASRRGHGASLTLRAKAHAPANAHAAKTQLHNSACWPMNSTRGVHAHAAAACVTSRRCINPHYPPVMSSVVLGPAPGALTPPCSTLR